MLTKQTAPRAQELYDRIRNASRVLYHKHGVHFGVVSDDVSRIHENESSQSAWIRDARYQLLRRNFAPRIHTLAYVTFDDIKAVTGDATALKTCVPVYLTHYNVGNRDPYIDPYTLYVRALKDISQTFNAFGVDVRFDGEQPGHPLRLYGLEADYKA